LDLAFVRHWLLDMLGTGDERIATWTGLLPKRTRRPERAPQGLGSRASMTQGSPT